MAITDIDPRAAAEGQAKTAAAAAASMHPAGRAGVPPSELDARRRAAARVRQATVARWLRRLSA